MLYILLYYIILKININIDCYTYYKYNQKQDKIR